MTVDDILDDLSEVIRNAARYQLDHGQLALLQQARQKIEEVSAAQMCSHEDDYSDGLFVAVASSA